VRRYIIISTKNRLLYIIAHRVKRSKSHKIRREWLVLLSIRTVPLVGLYGNIKLCYYDTYDITFIYYLFIIINNIKSVRVYFQRHNSLILWTKYDLLLLVSVCPWKKICVRKNFYRTLNFYAQAIACIRLSYGNYVCLSVCPSVRHDPVPIQAQGR